jgi:hypothetical protein
MSNLKCIENKTTVLLNLNGNLKAKLRERSLKDGLSMTAITRIALQKYLKA